MECPHPPTPPPHTPAQAAVLLLFNDVDTLSYKEIAAGCGLEEKELKRTLQSLACGKVRVGASQGGPSFFGVMRFRVQVPVAVAVF